MAEGGRDSAYGMDTVDMEIRDCSDSEEEDFMYVLPTGNRFGGFSGRGSGWIQSRRAKRKKVSSTESHDGFDLQYFNSLDNYEKLSSLSDFVLKYFSILNDVEKEQTIFCQKSKELKSRVDRLQEQAIITERVVQNQNKLMTLLTYRSIDIEARSKRNNVIVWGVSEKSNIRLEELILNFFEDEMAIETSNLTIESVHRMGHVSSLRNRNEQDPKRPIIVKFGSFYDTERIMKSAYRLKGTPFGIDRDYPREIAVARKDLYRSVEAKHARQNRHKLQIKYPAKLYINGELVRDKFPEWKQYLNESIIECLEAVKLTESITNVQTNGTAYNRDTEEDQASDSSEEERIYEPNDCVSSKSDTNNETKEVKTVHRDLLSSVKTKTNKVSRDSESTRVRYDSVINSPTSTCSKNFNPKKASKTRTNNSKQGKTQKCATKSVDQHGKCNTSGMCISKPIDIASKYRHMGKPKSYIQEYLNCDSTRLNCDTPMYNEDGLIATENCDTPL